MTGVVQVTTTTDDEARAHALADALVDDRAAACVQVIGPVRSTYRWQGAVEHAAEWLLVAKTTAAAADALVEAIRARHPYEVPEVLVTPVVGGFGPYLDWVRANVSG